MAIPFAATNLLDLDAAVHDSITDAGGAVSLWEDIGPSGRDFAAGVTPDHNSTDDIVNFNGSNDYLEGGAGLLPMTGDHTIVIRFGFTGGRDQTLISSFDSNTNTTAGTWAVDLTSGNVPRAYITPSGGKSQLLLQGAAISPASIHTLAVVRSGHVFTLRVNGSQVHQLTDTGALRETATPFARLGTRFSQRYLLGGIVRVGVWGQALTGGDLDAVEDWAANGSPVANIPAIMHHRRMLGIS